MSRAALDAERRGVDKRLLAAFDRVRTAVNRAYPGISFRLVSGYRSPQKQAALRARWDRGDRRGLVYRPAAVSRHTTGRAIDVGWTVNGRALRVADVPRSSWEFLGALMESQGVRWGGRFSPPDLPHFEI
jgi:uncharacterized protein YcbK (DUF882 family)